jgi:hypothetical protein
MRQVLTYTAVLVGVYLAVSYATGAGQLITASAGGYSNAVRTLQGR